MMSTEASERSTLTTVPAQDGGAGAGPADVLVVDDNRINRYLLSNHVTQLGHQVVAVENGREALERLQGEKFDLVLLDVMMPEVDGYAVLEQMKADPHLREIPVIVISGLDEIESVIRCIERGAEDYLTKPFNPTLLKARIGACLEKKRLRDQEISLHQQLEANYNRLRELENLRDGLTHMVIHDLRTPLTALLTGLYTMEQMGEMNPDQREFWEMGVQEGGVLLGMINDLLDISKMEDGSLTLAYRHLTPEEMIDRAIQEVAPLGREKNLSLTSALAPGLPALRADEDKLRRTLVNLLGNAIKFTPEGGAILVSARPEGSPAAVLFSVTDSGEGIPREAFQKIFEKFGQVETRQAGLKHSTGLGLTFCKMAVEAHGGRIWVESELGRGSTFFFTLPGATA
jgi:two-component system sensor histidine kinase/response regulator